MPFKIRTKLIVAFLAMLIPLVVIICINRYNDKAIYLAAHKVEELHREISSLSDLQIALDMLIMPPNDYLITGDIREREEFHRLTTVIEGGLRDLSDDMRCRKCHEVTDEMVKRLYGLEPKAFWSEEMVFVKNIKDRLQVIKEKGEKIFKIERPVGSQEGAALMEEMDAIAHRLIREDILKHREKDEKVLSSAIKDSEKVWKRSWLIMIGGFVLSVAVGLIFAFFYSGFFVKPIKLLHERADAMAGGDFTARVVLKTGDELEQLANAMNEMAGKLDDFYGTLENQVEERTRELQESEERYRTMIESANDMIWTLDTEGRFTFINRQAVENAGYAVEEVIGKHYLAFIHPEDRAMREDSFKRTLSGERTQFTVKAFGKDHEERILILYVSSAPIYKEGTVIGIVNFGKDITELKKAEDAIRENEKRLKTITETAPNAIICMRSPGAVTLWNKSAERIFGYTSDEVIGKNLHDFIVPDRYKEKAQEGLKGFFETGTGPVVGKVIEIFALRRDGGEFPVELSISAMRIKDEWQTAAIVRDITERKVAEEKLKKNLDELKRMNKMMVDREIRMIELKKENQKLINEIQDLKFKIPNS